MKTINRFRIFSRRGMREYPATCPVEFSTEALRTVSNGDIDHSRSMYVEEEWLISFLKVLPGKEAVYKVVTDNSTFIWWPSSYFISVQLATKPLLRKWPFMTIDRRCMLPLQAVRGCDLKRWDFCTICFSLLNLSG